MLGLFLKYSTYPWDSAHKIIKQMFLSMTSFHKGITQSMTQSFLEDACKLKMWNLDFPFTWASSRKWGHEHKDEECLQDDKHFSYSSHTSRQDKGNATLLFRAQPIKSQKCGNPSWVGFWVFSCTDLDCVHKFLDWHLEYFFLEHKCLLRQHLNFGNYSKSGLRICSEFYLVQVGPK